MPKPRKVNGSDKTTSATSYVRSADFSSFYANFARVGFNPYEIFLFLGQAGLVPENPAVGGTQVELKAKVTFSVIEAKLITQMLGSIVNNYEKKYGAVAIPPDASIKLPDAEGE